MIKHDILTINLYDDTYHTEFISPIYVSFSITNE